MALFSARFAFNQQKACLTALFYGYLRFLSQIKNPTYVFICFGAATEALIIGGMATFGAKLMQEKFHIDMTRAGLIMGKCIFLPLCVCMPPSLKKLREHIGLAPSVCPSVTGQLNNRES